MSSSELTKHAIIRMSQRAIRPGDLEMIELLGTDVEDTTIILRKDAEAFEREAKRAIDQVWRLVGKLCVRDGATVITAYHATRAKEQRLLRRA